MVASVVAPGLTPTSTVVLLALLLATGDSVVALLRCCGVAVLLLLRCCGAEKELLRVVR